MPYDNTNSGALFKNDKRITDRHPNLKGTLNVGGVEYWVSAWVKIIENGGPRHGEKMISLALTPKDENSNTSYTPTQEDIDYDDDIPF